MTGPAIILSELTLNGIGIVVANDAARSSFTVGTSSSVVALDGDLTLLHRWPIGPPPRGWYATSPARGLALISDVDAVRLLDESACVVWSYQHAPWSGDFESGCTWFDGAGRPHAVVPAPSYDGCLVLQLDPESGHPLAELAIDAAPAGISPITILTGGWGCQRAKARTQLELGGSDRQRRLTIGSESTGSTPVGTIGC